VTRRGLAIVVALVVAAFVTAGADAYFSAGVNAGAAGAASAATLPAGSTPAVSLSGRDATVSWAQSTPAFLAGPLGTETNGGYLVARYADGGGSAIAPAGCGGLRQGSADPLACTETGIPTGRWTYTVTPELGDWAGPESPQSADVVVPPASPTSVSVVNGGGLGGAYVDAANEGGVDVDVTLPATSLSSDTLTLTLADGDHAPVTATEPGTAGAGTIHFTGLDLSGLADGEITIGAAATSSYGDGSGSTSIDVSKDTAPPDVHVTAGRGPDANGWYDAPVTFTASTSTDAGSGIRSCDPDVTYSGPDTSTGSLTFHCADDAGNSAAGSTAFEYDATPPASSASLSPAPDGAGWDRTDVTVTLSAADATSGVGSIAYSATGAQPIAETTHDGGGDAGISITAEGTTTISFHATDAAGNAESPEKTVTVRLDRTAPDVSIESLTGHGTTACEYVSGASAWYSTSAAGNGCGAAGGSFAVAASADDGLSGVADVLFPDLSAFGFAGGGDVGAPGPYSAVYTWTSSTGGSPGAAATAADLAGNQATAPFSITLDNTPPAGAVTSPAPGPVSGTVALAATGAADNAGGSGLASVAYYRCSDACGTSPPGAGWTAIGSPATTGPDWSASWDTSGVADGSYTLEAVLTDDVGNEAATAGVGVTVGNGPSVAISPTDLPDSGTPTLTVTATGFAPDHTLGWGRDCTKATTIPMSCPGFHGTTTAKTDASGDLTFTTTPSPKGGADAGLYHAFSVSDGTHVVTVVYSMDDVPTAFVLENGGSAGAIDDGDTVVIAFSSGIDQSSICSSWSVKDGAESQAPVAVTATVADGKPGADDTLSVTGNACGPRDPFRFGSLDLGSGAWVSAGDAFPGSTAAYCARHEATGLCSDPNVDGPALVLRLGGGAASATVAGASPAYSPDPGVKDVAGNKLHASPWLQSATVPAPPTTPFPLTTGGF
jgi:hypothetical protein